MSSFPPSDPQWVLQAQEGDRAAFERLIRHNQGRVYAVCMGITRNKELAAEAAQDAFLSGWRALPGFRAEASFDSWIYRIGINAALRIVRKAPPTVDTPVEDLLPHFQANGTLWQTEPAEWSRGPDRQLWIKRVGEAIEAALPALDPKYRVPFVLRELEDMPVAEIGETLGLSVPAVKTRVHRARLMLRTLIDPALRETTGERNDSKAGGSR